MAERIGIETVEALRAQRGGTIDRRRGAAIRVQSRGQIRAGGQERHVGILQSGGGAGHRGAGGLRRAHARLQPL